MKESNRIALCNTAIITLLALLLGVLVFAAFRAGAESAKTAEHGHSITISLDNW